mmetsp:Transcript_68560/g.198610  ORF Transcript_68560/g.198610 Transcript_68560/m.198610 type:complete len:221 (-) Transcript_68560:3-665(-)
MMRPRRLQRKRNSLAPWSPHRNPTLIRRPAKLSAFSLAVRRLSSHPLAPAPLQPRCSRPRQTLVLFGLWPAPRPRVSSRPAWICVCVPCPPFPFSSSSSASRHRSCCRPPWPPLCANASLPSLGLCPPSFFYPSPSPSPCALVCRSFSQLPLQRRSSELPLQMPWAPRAWHPTLRRPRPSPAASGRPFNGRAPRRLAKWGWREEENGESAGVHRLETKMA